jgi:polycystin 2
MFLAIINDTYSVVKSDIACQKSDFELGDFFKRGYDKILVKMNLKKDKIVDIQKAMESADVNKDKTINFNEWKAELRVIIFFYC